METEEHQQIESMETEEEVTEKHSRPKQNAGILHATTPMPIKKEITEENLKKEKDSSGSDSEESDASTDDNFQKVIANDNWEKEMQRQIDEAYASNEMPAQMDKRFIKRPQRTDGSSEDNEKKDTEKSKSEQNEESANKKEDDNNSDVSLDEDEYDNLMKELESKEPDELTEEMRAKLTEAQKAKEEKLENYIKKNTNKKAKKKSKEKEKKKKEKEKEKSIEITPMTPGRITNTKNSADTPILFNLNPV